MARGDVLLFLNADTEVDAGAPETLAAVLADPEIGVAVPSLLLADDPTRLNAAGNVVHLTGLAWPGRWGEPADPPGELRDVPYGSGAALAIRAETFRRLGGFAEELWLYQEDLELSWRARLAGLRVVLEPAATVSHSYRYDPLDAEKHYWLERNRLVFVLTAYSGRLLALLAPVLLASEIGLALLARRDGWWREKRRGWAWLLRNRSTVAKLRRRTQGLRQILRPRGCSLPHRPARPADARGAGGGREPRAAAQVLLATGAAAALATRRRYVRSRSRACSSGPRLTGAAAPSLATSSGSLSRSRATASAPTSPGGTSTPSLPSHDELGKRADPRRDHRPAERPGFLGGQRERLLHERGHHHDVEAPVDLLQPAPVELARVADPLSEVRLQTLEKRGILAASVQRERRVAARPRERLAEHLDALVRREAPDEPERDRPGRRPRLHRRPARPDGAAPECGPVPRRTA